jgi:hypothetical protein
MGQENPQFNELGKKRAIVDAFNQIAATVSRRKDFS